MLIRMILLAIVPLLGLYLYERLYYRRFKQYAEWPQLKPSLLWGHMKALHEVITKNGDPERHIDDIFLEVKEQLGNPSILLFDLRPVQRVLAVTGCHEVAEQVSRSTKAFPYSMGKSPTMRLYDQLLGPMSILTAEGEEWKGLRKRLNPGFAPQHLMTLLPCILDKAWMFFDNLDRYAVSGEEVELDELCVNLTFDIIGAVTMDVDLDAQLGKDRQSDVVRLYRQLTISYTSGGSSNSRIQWAFLNLPLAYERWRLSSRIDMLLKDIIKTKFAELQQTRSQSESKNTKRNRSVLSLSLQETEQLDSNLLQQTADQLKSFLFAGHDTTSIVLQWAFYELSRTPRVLNAIRQELDDIFGPESSIETMRDRFSSQGEDVIRRMTYVHAVVKEILRLHPPSGSARYTLPGSGFYIQLPEDGRTICLDGTVVYNCETLVHRDEAVYGDTKDDFMPERWLDNNSGSTSQVPPSAWRPFERGPRNCIGQELAMLEARVILACAVRRYDFTKVGLGQVARDDRGERILNDQGQYEVESRLFNIMQVTAKPIDGTWMRVGFVNGHGH